MGHTNKSVCVDMDRDLYGRSRILAAQRGLSLGALVREAVEEFVPKDIRVVIGDDTTAARTQRRAKAS